MIINIILHNNVNKKIVHFIYVFLFVFHNKELQKKILSYNIFHCSFFFKVSISDSLFK